jgi:predicted RNase H-like nuclease
MKPGPGPARGRLEDGWVGSKRVLGVDACRAGWVGIALDGGDVRAYFAPGMADLAARAAADGPVTVIAIDIPIGLPDASRRQADRLAREALGPRWPSLFITPVRAAVQADGYQDAAAENRRRAGEGLSRQAFNLQAKIRDVDQWLRAASPVPPEAGRELSFPARVGSPGPAQVVEAHPELSFAAMAGAPLRSRKTTWAGAAERRALLGQAGLLLPDDLGLAGDRAGVDDVLDAAAAAWTARRVSQGSARCLPPAPEIFSDGIPAAIWT